MSWVVGRSGQGNRTGEDADSATHPERVQLAEAFALDTVTALLAAPAVDRVFVVTADDEIADRMSALGADIIRESRVAAAGLLSDPRQGGRCGNSRAARRPPQRGDPAGDGPPRAPPPPRATSPS